MRKFCIAAVLVVSAMSLAPVSASASTPPQYCSNTGWALAQYGSGSYRHTYALSTGSSNCSSISLSRQTYSARYLRTRLYSGGWASASAWKYVGFSYVTFNTNVLNNTTFRSESSGTANRWIASAK
jgi:hypothetical protein